MNASVCSSRAADLGRRKLEEAHVQRDFEPPELVSGLLGTTALPRAQVCPGSTEVRSQQMT